MFLKRATLWVFLVGLCLEFSFQPKVTNAFGWDDISDAFEEVIDTGVGIIEDVVDVVEDVADTVASAFTSLGNAITGVAASSASWLYGISQEAEYSLISIYSIAELAEDIIEEIFDGFNATTWEKLSDGAKYIMYELDEIIDTEGAKLASYISEYIALSANFLTDLIDFNDYLPFPFDVIEDDDFFEVVDCIDDLVLETAIDFAENVATTLVDLGTNLGDDFNIQPIFNTETIKEELNQTLECLITMANDIKSRESSNDPNLIEDLIDDALDYFEFDDFTMGFEISFTACTLVCGQASIGFAVSTESNKVGLFYAVKSGVETSSVVGVSIEAKWDFWPSFDDVAESTGHAVSFDTGINIPFVSSIFGTTVEMSVADNGDFGGFALSNDIIDVGLGFNGAFGVGYGYFSTYWIESLSDVGDAWEAFEEVGDKAETNVELAIAAYGLLSESLNSGAYLSTLNVGSLSTSGTSSDSSYVTLACPSGEKKFAGNSSSLELGSIHIDTVVYGNITGGNWCNSTTGYSIVYDQCQWLSECTIEVSSDTFGNIADYDGCDDEGMPYGLQVIYSCNYQEIVYDIGCFKSDFWEIVDSDWIQDGKSNYGFMYDEWEERENGISKCSVIASDAGYDGFAMWNQGMCLVGKDLLNDNVYNKYNATDCDPAVGGLGSGTAMNVYVFGNDVIAFDDLGCWNDSVLNEWMTDDIIISVEDDHLLTQDSYSDRKLAVSKCAHIADERGYDGFGLFDGGACHISTRFVKSDLNSLGTTEGFNASTFNCGSGKGNTESFNVYTFPFVSLTTKKSKTNTELTGGAVAGIVVSIIVFLVIVIVGAWCIYNKKKGNDIKCGDGDNCCQCCGGGINGCCVTLSAHINIARDRGSVHQKASKNISYISKTSDVDKYEHMTPGATTGAGPPPPPPSTIKRIEEENNNNLEPETAGNPPGTVPGAAPGGTGLPRMEGNPGTTENTGPPLPPVPIRKQSDQYQDLEEEMYQPVDPDKTPN